MSNRVTLLSFHGVIKFFEALLQTVLVIQIAKLYPGYKNLAFFVLAMYTPSLIFSVFLGSFVDRAEKRYILICVLTALVVIAFLLSLSLFQSQYGLILLLILSFVTGIIAYLYKPTFKSITKSLFSGDELKKTNSLQSSVSHSFAILGAFIGGGAVYFNLIWFLNIISLILLTLGIKIIFKANINEPKKVSESSYFMDIVRGFKLILSVKNRRLNNTINCAFIYGVVPIMNFYIPVKILINLGLNGVVFSSVDAIYSLGMVLGGVYIYKYIEFRSNLLINKRLSGAFFFVIAALFVFSSFLALTIVLAFLCGFFYFIWGVAISEFQECFNAEDQGKAISSMSAFSTVLVLSLVQFFGSLENKIILDYVLVAYLGIASVVYAFKDINLRSNEKKNGLDFGDFANDYQAGRAPYRSFLLNYLPLSKQTLEIGAGSGLGTDLLVSKGCGELTLSEPNESFARILKKKYPDIDIIISKFEDIDEEFESVVGFQCWHWMSQNKYLLLDQICSQTATFIWRYYYIENLSTFQLLVTLYDDASIANEWLRVSKNERLSRLEQELVSQNKWSSTIEYMDFDVTWSLDDYILKAKSRIDHQNICFDKLKKFKSENRNFRLNIKEQYIILQLVKNPKCQ